MALLEQIDDYLNASPALACDVEYLGPYRVFFRRDSEMPELSYARPERGQPLGPINAVRAAFAARRRACRWEYLQELTPELTGVLVAAGFPPPIPRPLLAVTRESFKPEQHLTAHVRQIRPSEVLDTDRVLAQAYGGSPADADGALLRGVLERGGCVVAAFIGEEPVAAGIHSPVGGVTEVAGVGTLPTWQRQGLAGAVTSALVADALFRGCSTIFLSAADEAVARVYQRLGFTRVGTALDTVEGG